MGLPLLFSMRPRSVSIREPDGITTSGCVALSSSAGLSPFDGVNVAQRAPELAQPSAQDSWTVPLPVASQLESVSFEQPRTAPGSHWVLQPAASSQPSAHGVDS